MSGDTGRRIGGPRLEVGNMMTEALPTAIAIPMAMFEQTGLRKKIHDMWRTYDESVRNLDGDMAAKAISAMMFDNRDKCPLYHVRIRCIRFPNDRLFGAGVGPEQLSDAALGKRLDTLAMIDMPDFVWDAHNDLLSYYGIEVDDSLSGDGSNYTLYGSDYVEDGIGTMPMLGGNAKDHSTNRLQKNFYCMTDSKGILCYTRAYDGNTSDKEMNGDAIDFLVRKSKETGRRFTLTADCKLCYDDLLERLERNGLGYVTKVPEQFDDSLRDRTVFHHVDEMEEVEVPEGSKGPKGLHVCETSVEHGDVTRRLILFRLDSRTRQTAAATARKIAKLEEKVGGLARRRFPSEGKAREFMEFFVPDILRPIVRIDYGTFEDERYSTQNNRVWRVRVDALSVDPEALDRRNRMASTSVLITNLDAEGDEGADAVGIVRRYLDQYLSEKNFRLMKSGMKVDDVFLHKPGRQDATLLIVALSTLMSNVIDHMLKENMAPKDRVTCNGFCDQQVYTELVYDRERDTFRFNGSDWQYRQFLEVKDILRLQDRYLMGFRA